MVSRAKRVAAESGSLVHRVARRLGGVLYFFKVGHASCALSSALVCLSHLVGVPHGSLRCAEGFQLMRFALQFWARFLLRKVVHSHDVSTNRGVFWPDLLEIAWNCPAAA